MNFISIKFIISFFLYLYIYYKIRPRYRYIVISIAGSAFYFTISPRGYMVLLYCILLTYTGGFILYKWRKKELFIVLFLMDIAALCVYKYSSFIGRNLYSILNLLGCKVTGINELDLIVPIGISFFVFQSSTYLGDIYNHKISIEKNFIRYASFVMFFPTILCGPIQKSRNILPQLQNMDSKLNDEECIKGFCLLIYGLFVKLLISARLGNAVNTIFANSEDYEPIYYLIGVIIFSLYIYADFVSYSDMAEGLSLMMGIKISKNFRTPYLATSISEFWRRWHISLSEWFKEYIYIPLGGNRKGTFRTYINVMIIFLLSGMWHGADWNFIIWGVVNAILSITGSALLPLKNKLYNKLRIDVNNGWVISLKRFWVFIWITFTWIFFNNSVDNAIFVLKKVLSIHSVSHLDQLYIIFGSKMGFILLSMCVVLYFIIQISREYKNFVYKKFRICPIMLQGCLLAILCTICLLAMLSTSVEVNTEFLYFQF